MTGSVKFGASGAPQRRWCVYLNTKGPTLVVCFFCLSELAGPSKTKILCSKKEEFTEFNSVKIICSYKRGPPSKKSLFLKLKHQHQPSPNEEPWTLIDLQLCQQSIQALFKPSRCTSLLWCHIRSRTLLLHHFRTSQQRQHTDKFTPSCKESLGH
jgi:hypothetical protein